MKKTKDELMDEEWEFDSYDEMVVAAELEGRVCGDSIRVSEDKKSIEIFNYHQYSVRWKGVLKVLLITLALLLCGCSRVIVTLPDGTEVRSTRFLDSTEIGHVSYDDGSFVMEGYKSDMSVALHIIDKLIAEREKEKQFALKEVKP